MDDYNQNINLLNNQLVRKFKNDKEAISYFIDDLLHVGFI